MLKRIKDSGYPLQPMWVAFPLLCYTAAFISFVHYYLYSKIFWFHFAYTANAVGVLIAAVALIPSITTWLEEPENHPWEKKEGLLHVTFGVVALILFSVNLWAQGDKWYLSQPDVVSAMAIGGAGLVFAFLGAYFGWDLVQKLEAEAELAPLRDKKPPRPLTPSFGKR